LGFAALLSGLTALVAWTGDQFGSTAALGGAVAAGLLDVHASVASVCALVERGSLDTAAASLPILLGVTANTLSKLAAAWIAGGASFALRVLPGLSALILALWASWLAT
jgi:uncharacterized membrane protein (DUF4010 family)